MNLAIDGFCAVVRTLDRTNAQKALAILWYHDRQTKDITMKAGVLARIMDDHRVGTPNPTALSNMIRETGLAVAKAGGFALKPGARAEIREWLPANLDGMQPHMDHASGYLPDAVWCNTRRHIEEICRQLNGCHKHGYLDGAAVLIRRLMETLIIEVYEVLGRQAEIQAGGNYLMFGKLVDQAVGSTGIDLGRDTKTALKKVKELGDKSAHNRRFLAGPDDLANIRPGVRVAAQDMILKAGLQQDKSF